MFRFGWRRLHGRYHSVPTKSASQKWSSFRPRVESLEERTVLSFSPAVGYGAGTFPVAVAIGDFNGDGMADLAVANSGTNNVSILLNAGTGTYQTAVNVKVGSRPTSVSLGDFNGDGRLDLAVANSLASSLNILLGNGDGTFQTAANAATGFGPSAVTANDFNGDGVADLAIAIQFTGSVNLLIGNGNGTFKPAVNYATGSTPLGITSGDFNNDGKPDVAAVNYGGSTLSVLVNKGDGTFLPGVNYATGTSANPRSVAAADLNQDGFLDLVVANQRANNVAVFLGVGDTTFQPAVFYATDTAPMGVAVADFDGLGNADIVTANSTGNSVSFLAGLGDGTFKAAIQNSAGSSPQAVTAGDLNGDAFPDLAVPDNSTASVAVLVNEFANPVPVLTGLGTTSINEGSGDLTLIVTGENFIESSLVTWNAAPLSTTYLSSTQLEARVPAAHFADAGTALVFVLNPPPGGGISNFASFTIIDMPLTAQGGGTPFQAAAGIATGPLVLATFVDGGGAEDPSSYSAVIDWGDGQTSLGTVSVDGNNTFTVVSDHTYAAAGAYTISLTIQEDGFTSSSGSQATVQNAMVVVSPAGIKLTGLEVAGIAGAPLKGRVASFTSSDPAASPDAFQAIINWGDGKAPSVGTIKVSDGVFLVTGKHTYANESSYEIAVTVTDASATTATVDVVAHISTLGKGIKHDQTEVAGWWHNKHGQALISAFNGGPKSTALASWLATNFVNLYGAQAGKYSLVHTDGSYFTNSEVARFYQGMFNERGAKLDTELLTTALNTYASTRSLGGHEGQRFGFHVTAAGLGAHWFNIGRAGATFGVANNTRLNVYELLQAVDRRAVSGNPYGGDRKLRDAVAVVFASLNEKGDSD